MDPQQASEGSYVRQHCSYVLQFYYYFSSLGANARAERGGCVGDHGNGRGGDRGVALGVVHGSDRGEVRGRKRGRGRGVGEVV